MITRDSDPLGAPASLDVRTKRATAFNFFLRSGHPLRYVLRTQVSGLTCAATINSNVDILSRMSAQLAMNKKGTDHENYVFEQSAEGRL